MEATGDVVGFVSRVLGEAVDDEEEEEGKNNSLEAKITSVSMKLQIMSADLTEEVQRYMIEERKTLIENNVCMKVIGRRDPIPEDVQKEMDKTIELTKDHKGVCLCLAINYGGRGEIVDAIKEIGQKVRDGSLQPEDVNEQLVSDHLYTSGMSDPDLLVRTAGEMRVSNYLLWQISYAEIWVTQKCWPEFGIPEFHQAIRDFASRDRRFGGLNKPAVPE